MNKPWGLFRSLLALAPILVLVPLFSYKLHYCESCLVPFYVSKSLRSPASPRDLTVSTRSLSPSRSPPLNPHRSLLSPLFVGPTRSLDSRKYQSQRYSIMPSTCQRTSVIGRLERENTPWPTLGYSKKLNSLQKVVQRIWNAKFGDNPGAGPTGMSGPTT